MKAPYLNDKDFLKKFDFFTKLGALNYKKHLAENNIFMYNILLQILVFSVGKRQKKGK